jgi:Carboxypeptidase regulatory-like domain
MCRRTTLSAFALASILSFITSTTFLSAPPALAQQTLGGITGTVTDSTGGALASTTVTIVNDQTTLTRSTQTNDAGAYDFVNLPIGSYTLTYSHTGFQTQKIPSITVQGDRTATVNATLKIGEVGSTITVEATPLLNSVDTTNGYILEKDQIESVPLPTGSFTGLAVLSPGVSSELAGSTGVNNGLGNKPIWANGQRDTSNTFQLNGVDASNLFNGKSTSSVASARVVNNTGLGGSSSLSSTTAAPLQSSASPYLAVGQALPTPAPDSIEEFRVNTSMYDAQQGSTSGAHIDMSTASGTNEYHGRLYGIRSTPLLFSTTPIPTSPTPIKFLRSIATPPAAPSAVPSSKTNSSVSSATSTCTTPIRKSAARATSSLPDSPMTAAPPQSPRSSTAISPPPQPFSPSSALPPATSTPWPTACSTTNFPTANI